MAKRNNPKVKMLAQGGFDIPFFLLTMVLLTIGLIMLFSSSYAYAIYYYGDGLYFFKKQLLFAIIGVVGMIVVSRLNYHTLRVAAWPILGLSLLLLAVVLILPGDEKDFHRWINLGFTTFQPSEIAKFGVVLFFAHMISLNQSKMKTLRYGILPYIAILGVMAFLMLREPHLSGTILILSMGIVMMFVGGASLKWFGIFGGVGAGALAVYLFVFNGIKYALIRLQAWTDKSFSPMDARWQVNQSLYAIGSGGFLGAGIGNSKQKYLYVSEPQNDFVFSIVCEELGFIGAALIILLFALLLWRGFVIAMRSPDQFGSLLAIGLVFQVGMQAALNIAVVTDSIPNTGISLPFFSAGGTALVMLLLQMGVVLGISRYASVQKT